MASSKQVPPRRQCEATKLDGTVCRGWAVTGSDYCFKHDPEYAVDREEAVRRGGEHSGTVRALRSRYKKLDTVPALVRFTATLIQDVLNGQLDPEIARTVLYGLSIQRHLVTASDLGKQIEEIREELERRTGIRRAS